MGRRQQVVYHVEPSRFPPDFPDRLERFIEAAGLSWRGLARRLRVSARCVWRWKAGARPDSGHLLNLLDLAAGMGLLHILLPSAGAPELDAHGGCDPEGRKRRLLCGHRAGRTVCADEELLTSR